MYHPVNLIEVRAWNKTVGAISITTWGMVAHHVR